MHFNVTVYSCDYIFRMFCAYLCVCSYLGIKTVAVILLYYCRVAHYRANPALLLLPRAHAQGVKQSSIVVVVTPRACARGTVIGCVCC